MQHMSFPTGSCQPLSQLSTEEMATCLAPEPTQGKHQRNTTTAFIIGTATTVLHGPNEKTTETLYVMA